MPLRSPSCKLRLTRISDRLKFQDGPSVAIDDLFNRRRILRNKDDDASKDDLKKIEDELAEKNWTQKKFKVGGRPGGWLAGWLVGSPIIMPLRSPSCKLRLTRISDRLKFQDGPSVAIFEAQLKYLAS